MKILLSQFHVRDRKLKKCGRNFINTVDYCLMLLLRKCLHVEGHSLTVALAQESFLLFLQTRPLHGLNELRPCRAQLSRVELADTKAFEYRSIKKRQTWCRYWTPIFVPCCRLPWASYAAFWLRSRKLVLLCHSSSPIDHPKSI